MQVDDTVLTALEEIRKDLGWAITFSRPDVEYILQRSLSDEEWTFLSTHPRFALLSQ